MNEEKFLIQSNELYLNMQESWTFTLNEDIKVENSEILIQNVISRENKDFGIFLSYYFRKDGAVVENVSFNSIELGNEKTKGKVMVSFDLIHFNACLNIHEQGKEKMELTYHIFFESNSIEFKGPFWPERGMDEI